MIARRRLTPGWTGMQLGFYEKRYKKEPALFVQLILAETIDNDTELRASAPRSEYWLQTRGSRRAVHVSTLEMHSECALNWSKDHLMFDLLLSDVSLHGLLSTNVLSMLIQLKK